LKTAGRGILSDNALEAAGRFRALAVLPEEPDESLVSELLKAGSEFVEAVQKALTRAALE
jgi:hypothetical protein